MIKNPRRAVANWLFFCCSLIFAMIIVGAITRLSESGLSIVEWNPLMGAIPPLDEAEWNRVFDLYKQSPEFVQVHSWMQLADFKKIFFWEWAHRFLGRVIGLVFALPLAFFWIMGWLARGEKIKLLTILALGALQGFMGWFMVQSGLVDEPSVSHYRLAAHLALALLIYALIFWMALSFMGAQKSPHKPLFIHGRIMLTLLVLTILWGACVAGLDAGLVYNYSFPLMGQHIMPPELLSYQPAWMGIFEDPAGVQFLHRCLAMITLVAGISLWGHAVHIKRASPAFHAIGILVMLQFSLGIATLFSGVALPLAVLHQAGAVLLLTFLLAALHRVHIR